MYAALATAQMLGAVIREDLGILVRAVRSVVGEIDFSNAVDF